jgi:iron complex outermembrane receptor protein
MINRQFTATIGGSNLFDVYPKYRDDPSLTETGSRFEAIQMGMGGAFYFAKLGYKF